MRSVLAILLCTLATGGAWAATRGQGPDRPGKPAIRGRRPVRTDPGTTGPARRVRRPHASPRATGSAPRPQERIPLGLFDGTGGFSEVTEGADPTRTPLKHTLAGGAADK